MADGKTKVKKISKAQGVSVGMNGTEANQYLKTSGGNIVGTVKQGFLPKEPIEKVSKAEGVSTGHQGKPVFTPDAGRTVLQDMNEQGMLYKNPNMWREAAMYEQMTQQGMNESALSAALPVAPMPYTAEGDGMLNKLNQNVAPNRQLRRALMQLLGVHPPVVVPD